MHGWSLPEPCDGNLDVGCKAADFIKVFPARYPDISHFYFKTYSLVDSVEVRLDMKEVRSLAAESIRRLLEKHPDPFVLFGQLLKHVYDDESNDYIEVRAEDFSTKLLELELQCRADGKALALSSLCRHKDDSEMAHSNDGFPD